MNREEHAANYQRESAAKTLSVAELRAQLDELIARGYASRPVFIMNVHGGLTHAIPISVVIAAPPYDGDIAWMCVREAGK